MQDTKPPDAALSGDETAALLDLADPVRWYLAAVSDYAQMLLERGDSVPGYKLVRTYGRRAYNVEEERIVRACRKLKVGKRQLYESKILSPPKLEKLIGKEAVSAFVATPPTGVKVVSDSDKRPALVGGAQEFDQDSKGRR
jgi:hypothetical protein